MNILIDNLVMSFKIHCTDIIFKTLNISPEKFVPSNKKNYYGYPCCLYYEGVKVHWRAVESVVEEVCLECSGKGCRTIEDENGKCFDWFGFLHRWDKLIRSRDAHISRIDIACDDTEEITDLRQVKRYTSKEQFVCRSKTYLVMDGNKEKGVYFGDPDSDRRLRIYDKALEQQLGDGVKWLRYEFQLRNDNATSFYLNWCGCHDIGKLYAGVMIDYLRFVSEPKESNVDKLRKQRHQSLLQTVPWWERFVNNAERIPQLYLPGNEYTFASLENYLKKQTNSSAKAYIIAKQGDVGDYLDQIKVAKLNPRQRQLLSQLGIDEKEYNI